MVTKEGGEAGEMFERRMLTPLIVHKGQQQGH